MKKIFLFVLLLISLRAEIHGQSFSDTVETIDNLFAGWNDSTPGAAILISRQGQALYSKSFGMADLEHGARNTLETVYESGSVAKQFTAAAIFLLIKDGKISLQDDVRKYIPELPDYKTTIRISHLIHHTSGLKDWGAIASLAGWPRGTKVFQPAHVLDIMSRQKSLNFTPGEKYSYSNTNYNLMLTIVERVTNQSFTEFTKERIFIPLQMNSTQWRSDYREVIKGRAIAYSKSGKKYLSNMPFENVYGHGGMLTTASDLLEWNLHWQSGKIGNTEIKSLQFVKGLLNNGREINYAGGVFIQSRNGISEISHSGATAGYRSWLAYYPEKNLSIVYLSNDGSVNPEQVGERLAVIFLGAPSLSSQNHQFSQPTAIDLISKKGVYRNKSGFDVLDIQFIDSAIKLRNGPDLKPLSNDSFLLGGNFRVVFAGDEVKVRNGSDLNTYKRVEAPDTTLKYLQQLVGTYYSGEAETTSGIELKNGKLYLTRKPDVSIPLTPTFKGGFYGPNNSMLVEFLPVKGKTPASFQVSISRAEKIGFVKVGK